MFQIEQDEDNKELSFHLKNYDDDEEENDDNDTKENTEERSQKHGQEVINEEKKESINEANSKVLSKPSVDLDKIKELNEKIMKEEMEIDDGSVMHLLFLKGTNLNIEGLPVIKFTKFKKENKIMSFFKVNI